MIMIIIKIRCWGQHVLQNNWVSLPIEFELIQAINSILSLLTIIMSNSLQPL